MCVCEYLADTGEDQLTVGTVDEEVPIDTEFTEYVDVEGRTTDYTVANDADLLTDGLHGTELLGVTTAVSKLACLMCFISVCIYLLELTCSPPLDNIRVMVIVCRLRGNVVRTDLC